MAGGAAWTGIVLVALGLAGLGLATVGLAQAPGAATSASPAKKERQETCRVAGMVVKAADGTPLKNATVLLRADEDREHTIAARTTADGRFGLKNVPAGRYKLTVFRNGYVQQEYGQQKPSDPGAALTLSPGQIKGELMFRLIPSSVISGRVFNEDGEPEPGVSVMASRQMYHEGHRTVTTLTQAQTDDLGGYRLYDLPPGRYFVSAAPRPWGQIAGDKEFSDSGAATGSDQSYAKTYYPGTPDPGRAVAISVKAGEEIPGTDISLKEVSVHRVRGRVINQVTNKPGREMEVELIPRTNGQDWSVSAQARVKKEDGSFEVANVAPGAYTIIADWFDPSESKMHVTSQKVDVGESDVEGLLLTLGAGSVVQGRIVWEGKPALEGDTLWIRVYGADGGFLWNQGARVDEKRQFTLKNLSEGDLKLSVLGASKDCYVKQIAFGQDLAKDDVISVSKGTNPALEITMSSRGARVQGAVTDKDGLPAAGVWVVAVPEESRRKLLRLFKAQTTDQYGKFDLRGLAPGSYKLFSWVGIEDGEWEDADFLKPFEEKGEAVEVQEEDVKSVNLKLMETKSEQPE